MVPTVLGVTYSPTQIPYDLHAVLAYDWLPCLLNNLQYDIKLGIEKYDELFSNDTKTELKTEAKTILNEFY